MIARCCVIDCFLARQKFNREGNHHEKESVIHADGRGPVSYTHLIAAAKAVSADQVAMKLEKGYASDVGEGGDRLSTGEKQLISFARAVLADPRIFVLDEATSSIDTKTERLIQDCLLYTSTPFCVSVSSS